MSLAKRFCAESRGLPTLLGHTVVAVLEQALLKAPQEVAALVLGATDLQRCLRKAWLRLTHTSDQVAESDTIAVQVMRVHPDYGQVLQVMNANVHWAALPEELRMPLQGLLHDRLRWSGKWCRVGHDGMREVCVDLSGEGETRAIETLGGLYRDALAEREHEQWAEEGSEVDSEEERESVRLYETSDVAVAEALERLAMDISYHSWPAGWNAAVHARLPRMRLVLLRASEAPVSDLAR
tara:strand:- start:454 stop:1167 length:714 start_codon:yes stop_codon:yes gene_type:complete